MFDDIKYPFKLGGVSHNRDIVIFTNTFDHLAKTDLCLSILLGPEGLLSGVLWNVQLSSGKCCNLVRVLFLGLPSWI